MKVEALKSEKIRKGDSLYEVIDSVLADLNDGSIVVLTSKIISICEGRIADIKDKDKIIVNEADSYIEGSKPYGITLTIKNGILIPNAGIDESNVENQIVLWPENAQKTANEIREYLQNKFRLNGLGVIITDSKTTPLRWGTTGVGIAYSGFAPLKDYIGKEDIFGREMQATKANILDGLASAAVLVMGEGNEQTPIAIISDVSFIDFNEKNPSEAELGEMQIEPSDDIYAPILSSVNWTKGGGK